jgi:hypothetical protein
VGRGLDIGKERMRTTKIIRRRELINKNRRKEDYINK